MFYWWDFELKDQQHIKKANWGIYKSGRWSYLFDDFNDDKLRKVVFGTEKNLSRFL